CNVYYGSFTTGTANEQPRRHTIALRRRVSHSEVLRVGRTVVEERCTCASLAIDGLASTERRALCPMARQSLARARMPDRARRKSFLLPYRCPREVGPSGAWERSSPPTR